MPDILSKAAQDAEASQRARDRGHAAPDNTLPPVNDTTTPDELPVTPPAAAAPPAPTPPPPAPPRDSKRDAIAARFRETRAASEAAEDVDELRKFSNQGLPPEMVAPPVVPEPEPEIEPEPEPAPPPAPTKRKLTVRGKEVELTDEQLVEHAQKALAADDYLGEAKNKLSEVNELLRTTKSRAAPASPQPPNTPAADAGNETEPSPEAPAPEHHGKSPLSKVVELLQFGDPEEAAQELDRTIDERAAVRSTQALQRERVRNEATRSSRFLKEFADQHPDLANDGFANAAMEKRLFELQRDDLVNLAKSYGKDESAVPTNPAHIAQWHLYYRTEGHPVRDVPTLLKQTRDDFLAWKTKDTPKPADPTPKPAAPRIEVTVDRTPRRATIQQQPTRTVTPKPDATAPAAPRDRSAIVQDMIAQRAKPRGRVGV